MPCAEIVFKILEKSEAQKAEEFVKAVLFEFGQNAKSSIDLQDIYNYYFTENHGRFWIVANNSNDIIGALGVTISHVSNKSVLRRLYVRSDYRRKGIGQVLCSIAIDYLKSQEVTEIYATVSQNRVSALNFYNKNGWGVITRPPRLKGLKATNNNIFIKKTI